MIHSVVFAIIAVAGGQVSGAVRTLDTEAVIRGGADGLHITALRAKSSPFSWVHSGHEQGIALIDHAFVNGRRFRLNWVFRERTSDAAGRRLTFRFAVANPRLELVSS